MYVCSPVTVSWIFTSSYHKGAIENDDHYSPSPRLTWKKCQFHYSIGNNRFSGHLFCGNDRSLTRSSLNRRSLNNDLTVFTNSVYLSKVASEIRNHVEATLMHKCTASSECKTLFYSFILGQAFCTIQTPKHFLCRFDRERKAWPVQTVSRVFDTFDRKHIWKLFVMHWKNSCTRNNNKTIWDKSQIGINRMRSPRFYSETVIRARALWQINSDYVTHGILCVTCVLLADY